MGDFVQIERKGPVAILRMNQPDRLNAIADFSDCEDLIAAIDMVNADITVAAAILTGNGRGFSAGGNLAAMKAKTGIGPRDSADDTRRVYRRGVQEISRTMEACEVPLIAAVNGPAVGLGCDIACLCDIRIASENAIFAASFTKIGLIPGDGGAWALQQAIGYARAAEMMLTSRRYDAAQALALGLVNGVHPADRLMDEAMDLADGIASNPVRATRMTKRLLRRARQQSLDDVLELSAAMQAIAHDTDDHREAVDAFLEKRAPDFSGQ
ncbi:enoyl-CoA hydratase-related protein [Croceicoccus sp. YJ47]|uniref:enoyl-CoA hydratase-related protein n=1 Tax=Croceicoccus sp. YJ47 TaxID=2798724 RepID=UPI001922F47F|nr:enoyl-CoA hydratase-related protein [Croceicoccus sp. YJ47]QQN74219.1 enoyl-CoA hydratase/isomerase family protein [Croceicoccus sp. YJ47]